MNPSPYHELHKLHELKEKSLSRFNASLRHFSLSVISVSPSFFRPFSVSPFQFSLSPRFSVSFFFVTLQMPL